MSLLIETYPVVVDSLSVRAFTGHDSQDQKSWLVEIMEDDRVSKILFTGHDPRGRAEAYHDWFVSLHPGLMDPEDWTQAESLRIRELRAREEGR